jgi:Cu2+-exporting ATPase
MFTRRTNEAMLTGESKPVAKEEGDAVIGGAINGEGAIVIEVRHTGTESFLSGAIKLVEDAQASKSRTQDIANRAAFWLTVVALSVSALTLLSWLFFAQEGVAFGIERAGVVFTHWIVPKNKPPGVCAPRELLIPGQYTK